MKCIFDRIEEARTAEGRQLPLLLIKRGVKNMMYMLSKQLEAYLDRLEVRYHACKDGHRDGYEIQGVSYKVYVHFEKEEAVFSMHTLHQERYQMNQYRMDSSVAMDKATANERTCKTLKGVVNYIERYIYE
jgi:hypothetical protein